MTLPASVGIVGQVVKFQSPHVTNDAAIDDNHFAEIETLSRLRTQKMISVPVVVEGQTVAVVQLLNKEDGSDFSAKDVATSKALACEVERLFLLQALRTATSLLPEPARNLLTISPSALLARQIEGSVLVADIVNSTALIEGLSAAGQKVQPVLSNVLGRVAESVRAQGGWIAHYPGDAVIAVFEPNPKLDRPETRAFLAALTAEKAVERLRVTAPDSATRNVYLHLGLARGNIEIGPIGAQNDRRFSVDGLPVYAAFRQLKQPGRDFTQLRMTNDFLDRLYSD